MSIQSTINLQRSRVIERIKEIDLIISNKDYLQLEENSAEYDYDIYDFINKECSNIELDENYELYTNEMLEKIIDNPFYRFSIFNNYFVIDDIDI